jgi:SAM-dependent methyltransferase
MQEMLEVAACQGWQAGVGYFLDKQPLSERRYYSDYATSEARADWRFLIPLPKQSRVLDIGSGLGAITFALARAGSEIYALDPTYENLRFIEIRREQESLSNLHPVRAETGRLPFPDSYFDLVVMIGVLEWVGDAYPHGDPVRIQQQVLENVQAVLKPGGYLYLAMENRYGYSYLLGRRDEHTNLRFITPLPRVLAALYSHLARRRAYRTYTHSYRTLKGLLGSAGFAKADFYYPVPGYQTPQFIVPLSSNTPFQFLLSTFLRSHHRVDKITYTMGRIVALLSLQRIFCPAFSVLAEKAK